jgi:FtsP/CotA-like multicopper oxidase with cupredoxin domain
MINAGLWPQYLMGAFPNFFQIPDFDKDGFNSGGNGYKAGQAPGTHWYHAHKHGSTSLHIRNGLAGAFIIESSKEGGYDHVIRKFYGWDSYVNHEKIFVFQQFDPTQNLERTPRGDNIGKGGNQTLVNGLLTPTITMQPGEVQLWRLINATEGNGPGIIRNTLFQAPGFTFKQTAMDGVQLNETNYKNQPFLNPFAPNGMVPDGLTLAAGNRADLLVQAPMTPGVVAFKSGNTTLFFVNVAGTPVSLPQGPFPTDWARMPTFLSDLNKPGPDEPINQNSPVKFQWEDGRTAVGLSPDPPQLPPNFMINGKQFSQMGEMVDQCMPQDGLQDWVLENYTTLKHPFHIHINPFQVIRIETPTGRDTYNVYAPPRDFVWQDVVAIPAAKITAKSGKITNVTPGRVVIRQTYLDFSGTFVLHCHILAHEDRGMMQLVRVVKNTNYPKGCQDHIPEHH